MAILDFREIPSPANKAAQWDAFELFARDCLVAMGVSVTSGPDRGPDRGRDIIIEERRRGAVGDTVVRWLVSCKHKAHSGKAVSDGDEQNIRDRVDMHRCGGFIGFYSTLPSSSLSARLEGLGIDHKVYDCALIESFLLTDPGGLIIAQRYFPESFGRWKAENPGPADLLIGSTALRCQLCGESLLDPEPHGIAVVWFRPGESTEHATSIEDVYCCCKGPCDRQLRNARAGQGWADSWEDVSDIVIPTIFLKWVFRPINQLAAGWRFSGTALEGLKNLLWSVFPRVSRSLTQAERNRVQALFRIPWYIGGLGED